MTYSVDSKESGFYHVKFQSPLSFEEILSAIEESEGFVNTERELWDLSGTDFNLSSDQLSIFAARTRRKTNKPQKTAIVALEDLAYGLARIYSVHREEQQTEVNVFKSEEEAIRWLFNECANR
jgi:hypothetical protein